MKFVISLFLFFIVFQQINAQQLDKIQQFVDEGKYTEAIKLLEKKQTTTHFTCIDYFQLGKLYFSINRNDKAEELIKKAVTTCPSNLSYLNTLADLYFEKNQFDKSDSVYNVILKIDSVNYSALNHRAKLFLKRNQFVDAFLAYEKLMPFDSLNPYYPRSMGYCMQKINDLTRAAKYYTKSLSIDSVDYNTIILFSNLLNAQNNSQEAMNLIDKGLAIYPLDIIMLKSKANLLYQIKKYDEASKFYLKAAKLGDSIQPTYRQLGICYFMVGAYNKEAIMYLEKAFRMDQSDYTSAFYLSLAYRSDKRGVDAKEKMLKAIDIMTPKQISLYYVELGNTYLFLKKPNEAINAYKTVLWYEPERKDILVEIAVVYETEMKDYNSALRYYQQFKNEYKDDDQELIDYTNSKITKIKEELFFRKEKKK